jgi:Spy/CpxP family protein refolding chaperone
MKSRWMIVALLLLTVVNLAALATFAYHRFCPTRCERSCAPAAAGSACVLQNQLGLDEAGTKRLEALRLQHQQRTRPLTERLAQKRSELLQAVIPAEPDTLQIRRLCRQIDSLQSAVQEWTVRHLMEQKQIFTPSQQEKFNTLMMNCCGRVPDRSANCVIHNK